MPYTNHPESNTNHPESKRDIAKQKTSDFIEVISLVLEDWIEQYRIFNVPLTLFCCVQIPNVSIKDYLQRSAKYLEFDEVNFIYMLIYIERFFASAKDDFINKFNIHRLAFSCLRLAHKLVDDFQIEPKFLYSRISGIKSAELNTLEIETISTLNFYLYVSKKDFLATKKRLAFNARNLEKRLGKQFMVNFSEAEERYLQQLLIDEFYVQPEADESAGVEPRPMMEHAAAASASAAVSQVGAAAASSAAVIHQSLQQTSKLVPDAQDVSATNGDFNPVSAPDPDSKTATPDAIIKKPSPEPIKYCATSQQWFYPKRGDLELDKSLHSERFEPTNKPNPI